MRSTAIIPLAMLQIACSATPKLAAGPYAHCDDLGTLTLTSSSRPDAEERMRLHVLQIGGDTFLFGERGRSGRLTYVPEEIVERRNQLLTPEATDGQRPIAAPSTDGIQASPGELWYYGAALRCNLDL